MVAPDVVTPALVFTAYNRPEYLASTLDSWKNVRGFNSLWKHVMLEPSEVSEQVENMFLSAGRFQIHRNHERQGVLKNPWNGLFAAFQFSEFVILAEDDVLVSSDILEYFNWAREEFKNDSEVATVCAFSRQGGPDAGEVYKKYKFGSPLIWGTWLDRWDSFIRDTWDKDYSHNGWDWHLDSLITEKGMCSVMPRHSRSDHIGLNGTHMTPDHFDEARGVGFALNRPPVQYWKGSEF